jgi:hypothetical protein
MVAGAPDKFPADAPALTFGQHGLSDPVDPNHSSATSDEPPPTEQAARGVNCSTITYNFHQRATTRAGPPSSKSDSRAASFPNAWRVGADLAHPISLFWIASNAGQDGGIVCEKVLDVKGNHGYNALTNVYEDLVKSGVIDPTKVTRTALANAASLLLTSDALIAEALKKEKGQGGGHRHGGDYDMY